MFSISSSRQDINDHDKEEVMAQRYREDLCLTGRLLCSNVGHTDYPDEVLGAGMLAEEV